MKKIILIALVLVALFTIPACAAWEVTASWVASTGPNLDKEELLVGNEVIATIQAGQQTAVVFERATLNGETVMVKSYNTAGVPNAGYVLGTLDAIAPPATATGGSIIIRWK